MILFAKDIKSMTREEINKLWERGQFEFPVGYTYKEPATITCEAIYRLISDAGIVTSYKGKELTKEEFATRLRERYLSDYFFEILKRAISEDEA